MSSTDPDPTETPAAAASSRWANIAWVGSSVLLVVLVVGIWLKVGDENAGANLTNAIISGDRPAAPALPTAKIPGTDAPGMPDWYATADQHQVAADGGEVLVVNWWASWCGPCKNEAPALNAIAREYKGRVTVVGVNSGYQDLETDARAFARDHELRFSLVRATRAHETAWGIGGFPDTFIVGTDGRISAYVQGEVDEETLRGLVEAELKQDRT